MISSQSDHPVPNSDPDLSASLTLAGHAVTGGSASADRIVKEHGPFRAYWCFWGEAFLQYLKHLFNMSNYKHPAYTVAELWCAKAKQRYRDPARVSWHQDAVKPAERAQGGGWTVDV